MPRHVRPLALGLLLAYAAPTLAQSFEGMDLSGASKKKKKHRGKRHHGAAPASQELSQPAAQPAAAQKALPAVPAGQQALPDTTKPAPPPAAAAGSGFGLDLSGPGKGAPAARPGKSSAPTMTFSGVDVSGKSGDRQRLDQAIAEFKDKKYEQAAINAWDLMNDPKMVASALESRYVLAKSLYRMGLYHASLGEFSELLSHGPESRYFQPSLEWLFFISHKTTNEAVILDEIAKYSNVEFPEKFKSEFHYLLARYYFVRGRALDLADRTGEATHSFEEVKRIAAGYARNDPFYPRVKYLEGLADFRNRDFEATRMAMQEVVKMTRQGVAQGDERQAQALRELAFMQLARTHYGALQNRYAIYYYGKIERGDPQWLESLFESAWASYRIGQYEQALGNLITLSSPFFRDEYFPEALILKAVIYYENCRYRESTSILSEFERMYVPVHDELDQLLKKDMDASSYYTVLADIQKKPGHRTSTDEILERVLKLALTDKDLKNTDDSIHELEDELDSFNRYSETFRVSNLAVHLEERLKAQRQQLVSKAGILAKGKLQFEQAELTKLLGNAERIRFETTGKEKEFLEQQLAEGGKAEIVKRYRYSVAVADDQLYWPYEGEYWRDELGTYQYTLTKGCIEKASNRVTSGGGAP